MAGTFLHQSSWYSNPWAVEFAERLGETCPGQAQGGELRGHGLGSQRDRHAHGARRHRQVRHRLHDPRPARRQPRGRGADQRRRQPPQEPRAADVPAKANALLPPYCYRCPVNNTYPGCDIACLKSSEEMLEFVTSQNIAGIMVETIPVPGGMIVPPQGVAAAARRPGQALGCAAHPRRMPAGAGPHRQDVGDGALWRDARHRHVGQGTVCRARHLRHDHDRADCRAGARQRRPAVGRHLFQRPAGRGGRPEAARHRAARQARRARRAAGRHRRERSY